MLWMVTLGVGTFFRPFKKGDQLEEAGSEVYKEKVHGGLEADPSRPEVI